MRFTHSGCNSVPRIRSLHLDQLPSLGDEVYLFIISLTRVLSDIIARANAGKRVTKKSGGAAKRGTAGSKSKSIVKRAPKAESKNPKRTSAKSGKKQNSKKAQKKSAPRK